MTRRWHNLPASRAARASWRRLLGSLPSIAAVLLIAAGVFVAGRTGWTDVLDNRLSALRFDTVERAPTGDVVIVAIDARSLHEINVWPWPRSTHGRLVDAAGRLGAARIAFDIDFSALSSPGEDEAFADALSRSSSETFLAAFVQGAAAQGMANFPNSLLLAQSWPAIVNVPLEADGFVRRFPVSVRVGDEALLSMAALLSDASSSADPFLIDYSIDAGAIPRISYVDLLEGRVEPGALEGKTLIVGATAIELNDYFMVPVQGFISGSTIIALATETLLQERALAQTGPPAAVLILLGLAALAVRRFIGSWHGVLVLGAMSALVEALAFYLQIERQTVLSTAVVHVTLLGFAVWIFLREFDLRRILLWVEEVNAGNTRNILERVVEDAFDGVIIVNADDAIVRTNSLALSLLGAEAASSLPDLHPALSDAARKAREDARAGREPGSPQLLQLESPPDGRRVLEFTAAAFGLKEIRRAETGLAEDTMHVCITVRDVTERHAAQERMRYMATHDSLTGVSSRAAIMARLEEIASHGAGGEWILLYFDLKGFKGVNDLYGHTAGDAVLVQVSQRAAELIPEGGMISRMGGDEFLALLPGGEGAGALVSAQLFIDAMAVPFMVSGHAVSAGARVGVLNWELSRASAEMALWQVDVALHKAKGTDATIVLYDDALEAEQTDRLQLESDLETALRDGQFDLAYQPQLDLRSGELIGVEALLRWPHPERGFVSPAQFIPVAEQMGLIGRIGAWVLDRACSDAAGWDVPLKVAVNVSALQFESRDMVADVSGALCRSGLPADRLEIEITESAFVNDSEKLRATFDGLLALGTSFALDDFGTGYSSLAYLHRFPIAKVKIDRSFVTGIPADGQAMAVLRSIQALATELGMKTIAEGVETAGQLETLEVLGCDQIQGYYYSRPIDNAALHDFMLAAGHEPQAAGIAV